MPRSGAPIDPTQLPPVMPVLLAAKVLDISRSHTYELIRRGGFPVPVLTVGSRMRVRRADLLTFLGIADPHAAVTRSA